MGAMNVGQATPYVEAYSMARAAAATIFSVIDRVPQIDSASAKGKKPFSKGSGDITFRDVHFNYPSRKDVKVVLGGDNFGSTSAYFTFLLFEQILQGLNLTIEKGETVALVGPSGCGK